RVIEEEEASFLRTLATGINLLDGVIRKSKDGKISGKDAFVLYDTYGFPIDLTELIAKEQGVTVDLEEFEKELQQQKERSRNAASQDIDDWQEVMAISESKFIGYDNLTADINIARYRRVKTKNSTTYQLVFDQTPFYGNSGGQIGDTGYIESANEKIEIIATEKENGLIIHIAKQLPENPSATFRAVVDADARQKIANNHTATHLVDYALRTVLGTHVEQKGSQVGPMGLRFDFSHFQKVTPEEIREVERLVNKLVRANYPLVENREATMAEAEAAGAIMLFGEKYGDKVRIVNFGPSTELCGGTHTTATGTIGMFKITSESAISAGVRRIEAVTGEASEAVVYASQDMISSLEQMVHNPKVLQAIEKMMEANNSLSREVAEMRKEKVEKLAEGLAENTPLRDGVKLITHSGKYTPEVLKDLAFGLRQRVSERLVMVIGNLFDGKPTLNIMLSDDVVAAGADAGATVREAAKLMNGGGGGQKHYATAGGKNPEGLQAAVDKAVEIILEKLK
ncbi:MAG: alanine--tRNA ligase-related protein, partial [Alistipes sp.]|nr:alanine--tRNA ligase-related protein [Alistipes sp.]